MQLGDKDIDEFQDLYERKFGKRLEESDARDKAARLIHLYQLIYKPLDQPTVRASTANT